MADVLSQDQIDALLKSMQGGGAADAAGAFDGRGLGAIVNSSRGIICAYRKEGCPETDYAGAARREALRMKEDLLSQIGTIRLD